MIIHIYLDQKKYIFFIGRKSEKNILKADYKRKLVRTHVYTHDDYKT